MAHIAALPTAELMAMLESWNPALGNEVAQELGKRGTTGIPDLRKGIHSENWAVRAGSAQALAFVCANTLADWKKAGSLSPGCGHGPARGEKNASRRSSAISVGPAPKDSKPSCPRRACPAGIPASSANSNRKAWNPSAPPQPAT